MARKNKVLFASAVGSAAAIMAGTAMPARAQWKVTVQSLASSPNVGGIGTTIDSIDEAETLLAQGGVAEGTDSPAILNYQTTFPGVGDADDFALDATGVVNIAGGGSLSNLTLYINSDDGFRVRRNGTTLFDFPGQSGGTSTAFSGVNLNNGDLLRVTFYERGGGQFLRFRLNDDNGAFIGSTASGITITQPTAAPEPASLVLTGLGMAGLTARRRWWRRLRR